MQFVLTVVCNVTAIRHSRLCVHWLMALVGGSTVEGEVCILRSPRISASIISLLSMGGVCVQSLTARKILFTGRQTCSLYFVLWLCGRLYLRWSARVAQFLFNQLCQFSPFWLTDCVLQRWIMIGCLFQPHCATSQLHCMRMHFYYILLVTDSARRVLN